MSFNIYFPAKAHKYEFSLLREFYNPKRRNYRRELEIIKDILETVSLHEGSTKTFIMYRAYLSYKSLIKYMNKLLKTKLLREDNSRYYLTDKGKFFLKLYKEYRKTLEELEKEYECLEKTKRSLKKLLSEK